MARWHHYLAFWSRRSTATVVPATGRSQARERAMCRHKIGYGVLISLQQANAVDRRLIRQRIWVRRRRDGTSPQYGTSQARAASRRQRSRYRPWL